VECVLDVDDNYRIIGRLVDSRPEEKKMRKERRKTERNGKVKRGRSAGNEEMRRKRGFRDT